MKRITNYIANVTEDAREWLAWKIFPEFGMYIEAFKRLGAIEENERCLIILEKSTVANAAEAQEEIAIKYSTYEDILNKLKEQGFDELPF